MKLKSDPKSINTLSVRLWLEWLSNLLKHTEEVKSMWLYIVDQDSQKNMLDIDSNIHVLRQAIKLHTESIFYTFSVYDTYYARTSWCSNTHIWAYLYQRIGDHLEEILGITSGTEHLIQIDEVIKKLKEKRISTVHTWTIKWEFLWRKAWWVDEENWDEVNYSSAEMYRENLEKAWIKLINLDTLV